VKRERGSRPHEHLIGVRGSGNGERGGGDHGPKMVMAALRSERQWFYHCGFQVGPTWFN
jgi:hypothetical protein